MLGKTVVGIDNTERRRRRVGHVDQGLAAERAGADAGDHLHGYRSQDRVHHDVGLPDGFGQRPDREVQALLAGIPGSEPDLVSLTPRGTQGLGHVAGAEDSEFHAILLLRASIGTTHLQARPAYVGAVTRRSRLIP